MKRICVTCGEEFTPRKEFPQAIRCRFCAAVEDHIIQLPIWSARKFRDFVDQCYTEKAGRLGI